MLVTDQDIFTINANKIALNLYRIKASTQTIYAIADSLESEYKLQFNKRFAKVAFLTECGLK